LVRFKFNEFQNDLVFSNSFSSHTNDELTERVD
jgi:hypothetical protein